MKKPLFKNREEARAFVKDMMYIRFGGSQTEEIDQMVSRIKAKGYILDEDTDLETAKEKWKYTKRDRMSPNASARANSIIASADDVISEFEKELNKAHKDLCENCKYRDSPALCVGCNLFSG